MRVERSPAAERVLTLEIGRPAKRSVPNTCIDCRPTVGQPKLRGLVSAGTNELAVLAVRHEPVREAVRLEPFPMPWAFIVECEPARICADLGEAGRLEAKLERHGGGRARCGRQRLVRDLECV